MTPQFFRGEVEVIVWLLTRMLISIFLLRLMMKIRFTFSSAKSNPFPSTLLPNWWVCLTVLQYSQWCSLWWNQPTIFNTESLPLNRSIREELPHRADIPFLPGLIEGTFGTQCLYRGYTIASISCCHFHVNQCVAKYFRRGATSSRNVWRWIFIILEVYKHQEIDFIIARVWFVRLHAGEYFVILLR